MAFNMTTTTAASATPAPSAPKLMSADNLRGFVTALLVARGMLQDDAAVVADTLVWADLRGVSSHGVGWLARFFELIEEGPIALQARPQLRAQNHRQSKLRFVLDARQAAGAVAMMQAAQLAVEAADQHGVCVGAVRDATHTGAIGRYAEWAAERGCAAIILLAGPPLMAYHGTRTLSASTTPIAIAVPGPNGPLLLDMATSVVPYSRLRQARLLGQALPEGAALDVQGMMTTDPQQAQVPLPIGGAKGAGLALMVELLTSVLLDNDILSQYLDPQGDHHLRQNALFITLKVDAYRALSSYTAAVGLLEQILKQQAPAAGADAIRLPGERGAQLRSQRLQHGIPLPAAVWKQLSTLATQVGVALPD